MLPKVMLSGPNSLRALDVSGRRPAFRWRPVVALVVGCLTLGFLLSRLPAETARAIKRENGPLESATLALFVVGAAVAWSCRRTRAWPQGGDAAFLLLACAAREFDVQSRFTSIPFDHAAFYVSLDVSWLERAVAVASLALVVGVGLRFIARTWRELLDALKRRRDYALSAIAGFSLLVVSQGLDAYRDGFKLEFREATRIALSCYEESLELGGAASLLLSLRQLRAAQAESLR